MRVEVKRMGSSNGEFEETFYHLKYPDFLDNIYNIWTMPASKTISLHLQPPVELLPAGHPTLKEYLPGLPPAWVTALAAGTSPDEAISLIWATLHERARGWVTRLATITDALALAVSPLAAFSPRLVYVSGWGGEAHGWLAGLPASAADLEACEIRLGCPLPLSYRRFAAIHDGLLENGDPASGFSPITGLEFVGVNADNNHRLLSFFGDGQGDRQVFDLDSPVGKGDFITLTWDHELRSTRRPQSFWSLLKELTVRGFG
jgi:hypothetical protein